MERTTGQIDKWVERGRMDLACRQVSPPISANCAMSLRRMFGGEFPEDLMEFYSKATGGCKIWAITRRDFPRNSIFHLQWGGAIQCGFELSNATDMEQSRSEMKDFLEAVQDGSSSLKASLRPFMKYGIPIMLGSSPKAWIYLPENPLAHQGVYMISLDLIHDGIPSQKFVVDFSSWLMALEKINYVWPESLLFPTWHDGNLFSPSADVCMAIRDHLE